MIDSSRKGAAVDSFYGTLKVAELSFAKAWQSNNKLTETECNFSDTVTCTNGVNFSSSGSNPKNGKIIINTENFYGEELEFNGYTCTGSLESEYPCRKKGTTKSECFTTTTLEDGTLSINGYDKDCGSDVVIPEEINGKKVTKIARKIDSVECFSNKGLTSVTFPNSLNEIGPWSFSDNKLETVIFPDNLKTIGYASFFNNKITTLAFNQGLLNIENRAFMKNELTNISYPVSIKSVGGGAFAANNFPEAKALMYGIRNGKEDKTILGSYAGKSIDTLTIPNGVKLVDVYAVETVSVNKLIAPSSLEEIGTAAFYGCSLKTAELNEGLKILADDSFGSNLFTQITLPSTIESISNIAFRNTKSLTNIIVKRADGTISNSPWGAVNATVNWTGTN